MLNIQSEKFRISVAFSFEGEFFVVASSRAEAEKNVQEHCGLTIGEIHSTLPEGDVHWNFPSHPTRKVGCAHPIRGRK